MGGTTGVWLATGRGVGQRECMSQDEIAATQERLGDVAVSLIQQKEVHSYLARAGQVHFMHALPL